MIKVIGLSNPPESLYLAISICNSSPIFFATYVEALLYPMSSVAGHGVQASLSAYVIVGCLLLGPVHTGWGSFTIINSPLYPAIRTEKEVRRLSAGFLLINSMKTWGVRLWLVFGRMGQSLQSGVFYQLYSSLPRHFVSNNFAHRRYLWKNRVDCLESLYVL